MHVIYKKMKQPLQIFLTYCSSLSMGILCLNEIVWSVKCALVEIASKVVVLSIFFLSNEH